MYTKIRVKHEDMEKVKRKEWWTNKKSKQKIHVIKEINGGKEK